MEIGVIGLGRMGAIVVDHLLGAGHEVVAFDLDDDRVERVDAGLRPLIQDPSISPGPKNRA